MTKPPSKRAPKKAAPSAADRAKAREQIASVSPIKRVKGTAVEERARHQTEAARAARRSRGNQHGTPTDAQGIARAERRTQVLNMRRLGLQWVQIAPEIAERYEMPRYTAADAYNDAKALIDSVNVEAVQGLREEDLALLLSLQRPVYAAAMRGDLKAVRAMIDILDRRSRYLGLDAPVRHQLTGSDGGPIQLDVNDPAAIYESALAALNDTLPHVPPPIMPQLPGGSHG